MAALARCAEEAGAVGIRANGPADIAAIKAATSLPVIGLLKRQVEGSAVYITPTFADARLVAEAGADLIAVDATPRRRPGGETLADLIARIQDELGRPVMADIATRAEGEAAAELGADLVASTLAGYTPDSRHLPGPDLELIRELAASMDRPIIAEGRYHTPAQAAQALAAGAHAVVVGTAITAPTWIAAQFVAALRGARVTE